MAEQPDFIIIGLTVYFSSGVRLRIEDEQSIIARIVERWIDKNRRFSVYSPFTDRNYAFDPKEVAAMVATNVGDEDTNDDPAQSDDDDNDVALPGELWNE